MPDDAANDVRDSSFLRKTSLGCGATLPINYPFPPPQAEAHKVPNHLTSIIRRPNYSVITNF